MAALWHDLSYYPGIFLEGLRTTTTNLSRDSQSPGRDLIPRHSKYEAGVLVSRPGRSVLRMSFGY
jgi:hypothetical protein